MLAAIPLVAGGGAWTRPTDGRIIRFGIISTTAQEEFDFQGGRRDIFSDTTLFQRGQFGMTDVSFYGELGLTDWLTGTLSTQYRVAVREAKLRTTGRDSTLSASGLSDIWVGGRIRLLPHEDSTAVAITLGLKIPTGSRNQSIPLGTGVLD
jgi:hypothetical protein